ncbi:hypothetical protein WR25_25960 [Diploscapter pachys]|uniref:Uncharacterized protein n=1 Tax=Diploscapter pachys TaxID=2018661 RepID=A0A2A2KS95_9BILA|nr:hypothetical protein WR25_25960 [Diploscapter pachys]
MSGWTLFPLHSYCTDSEEVEQQTRYTSTRIICKVTSMNAFICSFAVSNHNKSSDVAAPKQHEQSHCFCSKFVMNRGIVAEESDVTIAHQFSSQADCSHCKSPDFYDENAAMIEKGKNCVWGQKDIGEELKKLATEFGHTKFTAGILKGHYLQIWRKVGDKYLIYHDEFEML